MGTRNCPLPCPYLGVPRCYCRRLKETEIGYGDPLGTVRNGYKVQVTFDVPNVLTVSQLERRLFPSSAAGRADITTAAGTCRFQLRVGNENSTRIYLRTICF